MKSRPAARAPHSTSSTTLPRVLGPDFFEQKTLTVARDLIGKYLVRKYHGKTIAARITEVEAYVGPHDLASHSSKGRTARTEVMFGSPGTIYIYFVYGMHWMLNVVTEKEGYPAAVLIRGIEISLDKIDEPKSISGPGRVTKMFGIDKSLNGKMAAKNRRGKNGLWFEDRGEKRELKRQKILTTPRIGVDYAGPVWSSKKYRFVLQK